MKSKHAILSLAILFTLCTVQSALASGPFCPYSKAQASDLIQKMATYSIPGMDTAMVHKVAKAISGQPGVSSAKPDLESNQFAVIFDSSKLKEEKLSEAVTSVSPEAKLLSLTDAPEPAAKSKQAGCPAAKRAKCSKAKAEKDQKDHE